MPRSRASSAKKGKNAPPPPPPPVVHSINTMEDLQRYVTACAGSSLLVVVSPLDASSANAVVAAMEKLNSNRPPMLADTNIAVLYALPTTAPVCRELGVTSVPLTQSYAYGELVGAFIGDNTDKMELLAKAAAALATVKAAQVAEAEKQRLATEALSAGSAAVEVAGA